MGECGKREGDGLAGGGGVGSGGTLLVRDPEKGD